MTTETIHDRVRDHYAQAATKAALGGSCCGDGEGIGASLYSALERDELPDAAVLASLGCGNPTPSPTCVRGSGSSTWGPAAGSTSSSRPGGSVQPAARSGST